ncbi:MAG: nickel transporter [Myxococcota bacterium]
MIDETTAVLLAALGGLAAGGVHVLTGPDHLAAVVPLAAQARRRGDRRGLGVGMLWGFGHGLGVVLLGGLGVLLRNVIAIDVDAVSGVAEIVVGVSLIFLGLWTLRQSRGVVVHSHGHHHQGDQEEDHAHVHVHVRDATVGAPEHAIAGRHARHEHGAFAFGLLHGIAGTSHLVAALPALALGGAAAIAYIGGYLMAAIPLMALVGGAVVRMMERPERVAPALRFSGVLAASIGVLWLGTAFF